MLFARAFRERHPQLGQQPLSSLANYPQPKIVYDLSTLRTYVQTQNSLELYLGNFLTRSMSNNERPVFRTTCVRYFSIDLD